MADKNNLNGLRDTGDLSPPKHWRQRLEAFSGHTIEPRHAKKTVFIAIDCSVSMGDGLPFPRTTEKLDQAKRGAIGFANEAINRGYQVGLVSFSTQAHVVMEPSIDSSAFASAANSLFVSGSTNMAAAIEVPTTQLVKLTGERVICIVTDGQPDDQPATLRMAKEAKRARVDIMTIGTDDADRAFLEQIATRKELALKVERQGLDQGITSMAKLLKS